MTFDGSPISESDLLAWVEGDLAPERRREVDRAIGADAALRRTLEGMSADRAALRALGAERSLAPDGLVERALFMAQREALLDDADPVVARIRPMIRRRFAVAAALVACFGGAWFAINGAGMGSKRLRAPADIQVGENFASLTDHAAPAEPASDSRSAPGTSVAAARPDADAIADSQAAPRTREAVESMLPLSHVMAAIEAAESDPSRSFVSLEVLEGQPRPVSRGRDAQPGRMSPASYSDALLLAQLNRVNVSVRARDPEAVERAIRAYGSRVNRDVRLASQVQPDGSIRYAIETDRDEAELRLLLAALRNACDECTRTTMFDASLLPSQCSVTGAPALSPARPGGSQRVSVPVIIQRISE